MVRNSKPTPSEILLFEQQVFKEIEKVEHAGKKALEFVSKHNIRIKFSRQKFSGARWTLFKTISLNSTNYSISTDPTDPGLLSLVLHKIHHLQHGLLTALSVYGELDAWQVGFRYYQQLTGKALGEPLKQLLDIRLGWSRKDLVKA